jgi:hypothetical protein
MMAAILTTTEKSPFVLPRLKELSVYNIMSSALRLTKELTAVIPSRWHYLDAILEDNKFYLYFVQRDSTK